MKPTRFTLIWTLICWMMAMCRSSLGAETPEFDRDVLPILQKHCVACHSVDEAENDLALENYEQLLAGGKSGVAMTAGSSASSRLWLMMTDKLQPKMPPEDSSVVSEGELEIIQRWIDQGAPGPATSPDAPAPMTTSLRVPDIASGIDMHGPVTAIAHSADGNWQATGSFESIRWAKLDQSQQKQLKLENETVQCLRFSSDQARLFAATGTPGLKGTVVVLDVASGEVLQQVKAHADSILTIAVSPDGAMFATGGYDRKIVLWQTLKNQPLRVIQGHTGAIRSLTFSPSGKELLSGSDDQTVKVWNVETGDRLDTMGQATGSVTAVGVTRDSRWVFAGSSDNRLRVWRFESQGKVAINPLVVTRFIDETPITRLAISADDGRLVALTAGGNLKLIDTKAWVSSGSLSNVAPQANDFAISPDAKEAWIAGFDGQIKHIQLPAESEAHRDTGTAQTTEVFLDLASIQAFEESKLSPVQPVVDSSKTYALPRGAEISGTIGKPGETDWYRFHAQQGEMWVVETDTQGTHSRLDSIIEVRGDDLSPLTQVRLQAVRDSYFTFRGKDSRQNDDFRVFAWEEMNLNDYFYSSGEVTRLWMAPRGADSGFLVYPGRGNRWTYFGTSGVTHALGEPAYIVRPLSEGEEVVHNGLPVFELPYLNDDEPTQTKRRDSYLIFKAPADGHYRVSVRDTRGQGGDNYAYKLRVRPATPRFEAKAIPIKQKLLPGTGRELLVEVSRVDGYDGEVWVDLDEPLVPGLHGNFPLRVQPGQSFAIGNIWLDRELSSLPNSYELQLTALAMINGRRVERKAGTSGKLELGDKPNAVAAIYRGGNELKRDEVIQLRRGETVELLVKLNRKEGFTREVPLGKEMAGRNLPHGVFVDNIGLNGLLVRENEAERNCFITASPIAELGKREFFLTQEIDGNLTSPCYTIEIIE